MFLVTVMERMVLVLGACLTGPRQHPGVGRSFMGVLNTCILPPPRAWYKTSSIQNQRRLDKYHNDHT